MSQVRALDGGDSINTIAGGGNGDGFPPAVAAVEPDAVSVGPDGSIYIAESGKHRIRRIDPQTGLIATFAGIGAEGFAGDGGAATVARLRYPTHAVADAVGNVYICDQSNHRIRRVDANGVISTVAGIGTTGSTDGPATTVAKLYFPRNISVDVDGNVLIAEPFNQRVRFLDVAAATVSTVAGTGVGGFSGDNGPATGAKLQLPASVWSLGRNTFLIADQANHRIRKVETSGTIRTVAGNGTNGYSGENGSATSAALSSPVSVSAKSDGSFVIVDQGNSRVRRVTTSGTIQLVAGTGSNGYNGDGQAANLAQLNRPSGVTYTPQGDCLVADNDNERVRQVSGCAGTGAIATLAGIAGSFTGDGWPALASVLLGPADVVKDAAGNVYIADSPANRVRRITTDGRIETYAGTGVPTDSIDGPGGNPADNLGDGGFATSATLKQPNRLAFDQSGNLLILDTGNRRVRRVSSGDRRIATIAGDGSWGNGGDGGLAVNAAFMFPLGLAVDAADRVYVADASARRIRVFTIGGAILPFAGTGVATDTIDGPGGNPLDNLGDFGPALSASFIAPCDLTVGTNGTLYVADMTAHRVRMIDASGIVRPVAGTGTGTGRIDGEGGQAADNLGDGGLATLASVNTPVGVALTVGGDVLIADQVNRRLRIVRNGTISTLGGNGYVTWSVDGEGGAAHDDLGDGGSVAQATFKSLSSVFVDGADNVMVTDSQSERVRLIGSNAPTPPTATPVPFTPTPTFTAIPSTPTRTATPTHTNTSGPSNGSVSGQVKYYANTVVSVPNVEVDLVGPSSSTVLTNAAGTYASGIMPLGTWAIQPQKMGGRGAAVTALDAAYVLQHVAGTRTLNSDQMLACDVTGNGTLSALDATRILQLTVGLQGFEASAACNSDWLFIPSAGGTPPLLGGGSCWAGGITLNVGGTTAGQDFRAVLLGDCTGNWSPAVGGAVRREAPAAVVHLGRVRTLPGGRVRVPLYVQGRAPFQALQAAVSYDAAALTFTGARLRTAARDTILSVGGERSGTVTVGVASGTPIEPGKGALLLLEFGGARPDDCLALRLGGATVDERPARSRTHAVCR